MVKSYGSQYREFLREGSFADLLAKMKEKVGAAKKKDKKASKE